MAADKDDPLRLQDLPGEVQPRLSPDTDAQLGGDSPTIEVDGEERIDPDANEDLIDSAEADRLSAGADDEDLIPPAPSPLT